MQQERVKRVIQKALEDEFGDRVAFDEQMYSFEISDELGETFDVVVIRDYDEYREPFFEIIETVMKNVPLHIGDLNNHVIDVVDGIYEDRQK